MYRLGRLLGLRVVSAAAGENRSSVLCKSAQRVVLRCILILSGSTVYRFRHRKNIFVLIGKDAGSKKMALSIDQDRAEPYPG